MHGNFNMREDELRTSGLYTPSYMTNDKVLVLKHLSRTRRRRAEIENIVLMCDGWTFITATTATESDFEFCFKSQI